MKAHLLCFSQNLDYALGWMVVHSLWQAIAIALMMGIVMIVLRKKKAKVRYWVANISLMLVLFSAIATFAYYYDFSKEPGEVRFIPEYITLDNMGATTADIQNSKSEIFNAPLSIASFKNYFNEHIPLIVLVWAMGVALFILKLLGGISYCYYLRSRLNFPPDEYWIEVLEKLKEKVGVKQSIELVESALTRTPMVVGHLKPMILFPIGAINKLSPNDVEAILAHEIAHVLRKDYIFNIIQSVIEALFYYHPAVWWISSIIRNERENCCDDVAIEICGNSVDYAKALVIIQEMAYYPMYLQPAMAFAGSRKNQLLHRVQRILNQPQNKTNVMEKLIATCTLVLVMIGLSFGENTFSKNLNNTSPPDGRQVSNLTETDRTADNKEADVLNNKNQTYYLYFSERKDSVKVPDDIPNGIYNYEDNTQIAQLMVKDHYVVSLKVNDIELTNEQMPKYKRLINKILSTKVPNATQASELEPAGTMTATSPTNGYSYSYSDNISSFPSRQGEWDGKSYSSQGSVRTYIEKGIVTTFDEQNHKWVIKPEKDGVKFIEHFDQNGKFLENIKLQNSKVYINNRLANEQEIRQRGWELTGQGIQRIGGFANVQPSDNTLNRESVYIQSDTEGGSTTTFGKAQDLQSFRTSLKGKHKALTNKGLALKRKGTDIMSQINPTLNDVGRDLSKDYMTFDDLKNTERKLEWVEIYIENFENQLDDNDNNRDDLQSQIKELQGDVKSLRQEIKECECTTNFDFRMGLIKELDKLSTVSKAQNMNAYRDSERRFLKIKNDWERGECDDFNNNNKNTSNLDARMKSIVRKAESLIDQIDDCNCKEKDPNWVIWAKARLNAQESLAKANKNAHGLGLIENEIGQIENQFNRLKRQRDYTDCLGCPPGNSSKDKSNVSFQSNGKGYSYGTGDTYARAEASRKEAERLSKNRGNDNSEDAIHTFFQSLLDEGYISFNQKCTVSFSNNSLNIDGKRISGSDFERIKQKVERTLGKKKTYTISYTGKIQGSDNNLSITGALTTSFN